MMPGNHPAPAGAPARPEAIATSPAPECFARNVYYDPVHRTRAAKLLPGEYYVAAGDMMLVTVLGSCVAACIRDARLGVGGMNHFMLPEGEANGPASGAARYGTFAMEVLINHLLKLGARREHLEAKVFGGGNVLAGLTQVTVGERNAAFVLNYLATERIRIAARDLGERWPRKVYYFPASGRALVKRLRKLHNATLLEREAAYRRRLAAPRAGEVELFA